MKNPTLKIDRKRSKSKTWVTYFIERIGEKYAILTLDTRLKRPDLIYCSSSSKGVFEVEYWAGEDSYLGGNKVEQGTLQTNLRIPELDGWSDRMSTTGRYYIEILLEKRGA